MSRLPRQAGERIDRGREIEFSFDGRTVKAFEGDTIGSALHASGQRVISRSFKYHRPRGLLCCAGQCPNCMVEVDGWPGIRACTEPVRDGMEVAHMNASPVPAVRRDAGHRHLRQPGHPARLLLQDLHQAAAALAPLREGAAPRRRPRPAAPPPGGARVAHRVPPPPRRRAGDRRRCGRDGGGAAGERAGSRRRPGRRRPRARRQPARRSRRRRRRRTARAPGRDRGRGPGAGRGARLLRRDRPGLVREHPAPGSRRAPHRRHRLDRAAADVRGQRPARGDALLRRRATRAPLRGAARKDRGDRHHRRPRPGLGACPAWRRGRDRRSRRLPPGRSGGVARCGAEGGRNPPPAGPHGRPRGRAGRGEGRGDRRARRRRAIGPRHRARLQLRPDRRLRGQRPGDLAAAPGGDEGALGRRERHLHPRGSPRRDRRGGRRRRALIPRAG